MAFPQRARLPSVLVRLALATVGLLALGACGQEPRATEWWFGNALVMRVVDLRRVDEVRYAVGDKHYLIRPSQPDRRLAAAQMEVRNREANVILFNITPESITLRDTESGEYPAIDPFTQRSEVPEGGPAENTFLPFVWGQVELPQTCGQPPMSCQVAGWVLFEVPPAMKVYQLVWEAADTVYLRFR
ncbi:MAG: hypothetical protein HY535_00705 [Chloroflexi bacterium]|nr:hypothetical protein [Chloroflexota bacterium]